MHPASGDWDVETLFAAPHAKRENVVHSDAQENPRSIADIENQKPRDTILIRGLLGVDNMHLGYRPGGGGRHLVAIRRAGNQSRIVSFAKNGHFLTKAGCPDRGGGGGEVWRLADSMQPHADRITDPDVLAILSDRAHFRAITAWAVPKAPDSEVQYGEGE